MSTPRRGTSGRVVVVTGASAGIGRATAVAFAAQGCRVALVARGREGLVAAAHEVEHAGGEPLVLPADVGDMAQLDAAAGRVVAHWGRIDVWINAAMATIFAPIDAVTAEEYERATRTTYLGTVFGTMAALARMRTDDAGTIIQVGSALSYQAIPLQAPYCAAKFAIRGFTQSLRCELLHQRSRIHVGMVQLPAHNTPQFTWARTRMDRQAQPLPPVFAPEVAARAIVYAASRRRRELWVGLPAVKIILGQRLAGGLMERYLADKAWSGQMTDRPVDLNHADNLFAPLAGDHGTYGPFTAQQKDRSSLLWLSMHRGLAALATLGLLGLMAVLFTLA